MRRPRTVAELVARVAELEALLREAQRYADAAGVRAAIADKAADAALRALGRATA